MPSKPAKEYPIIGHYGVHADLMQRIKKNLRDVFNFAAYPHSSDLAKPLPIELLLYAANATLARELSVFRACMFANPDLPIILVNEKNQSEQIAEFLRSGASDFMTPPFTEHTLRKTLTRTLRAQHRSMTFWPQENVARAHPKDGKSNNRRQAYRAKVLPSLSPRVYFLNPEIKDVMNIDDISVFSEHGPGGMLLKCTHAKANKTILEFQDRPDALQILVDFASHFDIIRASAQIIRVSRKGHEQHYAIRYQPDDFSDSQAFQRFWMLCQRQQRQHELQIYRHNFA